MGVTYTGSTREGPVRVRRRRLQEEPAVTWRLGNSTSCWAEALPGDIPSRRKRLCKGRETREELVCSGACKSFGKSSFRIWKSDREGSQEGWDGEVWGK